MQYPHAHAVWQICMHMGHVPLMAANGINKKMFFHGCFCRVCCVFVFAYLGYRRHSSVNRHGHAQLRSVGTKSVYSYISCTPQSARRYYLPTRCKTPRTRHDSPCRVGDSGQNTDQERSFKPSPAAFEPGHNTCNLRAFDEHAATLTDDSVTVPRIWIKSIKLSFRIAIRRIFHI